LKNQPTLIEQYIATPAFRRHVAKITSKFGDKHIDDAIQNFCLYYIPRPEKAPNIRKLYNELYVILKKEKRYILFDVNDLYNIIDHTFGDDMIDIQDNITPSNLVSL